MVQLALTCFFFSFFFFFFLLSKRKTVDITSIFIYRRKGMNRTKQKVDLVRTLLENLVVVEEDSALATDSRKFSLK